MEKKTSVACPEVSVHLIECESCFRAQEWSRDPIPVPFENSGLRLALTEPWCSAHPVWKLSALNAPSNVIGLTYSVISDCTFLDGGRKRLL